MTARDGSQWPTHRHKARRARTRRAWARRARRLGRGIEQTGALAPR